MGRSPIQTTTARPLTHGQEHTPHAPSVGVVSTRHRLPDARPAPCRVLPPSPPRLQTDRPCTGCYHGPGGARRGPGQAARHTSEKLTERRETGRPRAARADRFPGLVSL